MSNASTASDRRRASGQPSRPWLFLASLAFVWLVVYWKVIFWLVSNWWSNPDYSHGFVIPVVSAVYIWLRRDVLIESWNETQSHSALPVGAALVGAGMIGRIAGLFFRMNSLEAASMLPFLGGLVLMTCGWPTMKRLWPAFVFLIFMIPIPDGILAPVRLNLQAAATQVSVFALQTLGVPALASGNVIRMPDAVVGVAEACSGLRMIVSLGALVSGITLFLDRGRTEKIVLLLSIVPIAVFVNSTRVTVVSIAMQYWPSWGDLVHDIAGLAMMFMAIALVWALTRYMDALLEPPQKSGRQNVRVEPMPT